MKSIEQIETEAKEAFEKDKNESSSFYPFLSGWLNSAYVSLQKKIPATIEATCLQMENYIQTHCDELKEKGLDDMFIQNTRSSMQHAVVMMRFFLMENYKNV